jgi:hypothetical protein
MVRQCSLDGLVERRHLVGSQILRAEQPVHGAGGKKPSGARATNGSRTQNTVGGLGHSRRLWLSAVQARPSRLQAEWSDSARTFSSVSGMTVSPAASVTSTFPW